MSEFHLEILKRIRKNICGIPGRFLDRQINEVSLVAYVNVGYTKIVDFEMVEDCVDIYYDMLGKDQDFHRIYFSNPNFFDDVQKLFLEIIGETLTMSEQSDVAFSLVKYLDKRLMEEGAIYYIYKDCDNKLIIENETNNQSFSILCNESSITLTSRLIQKPLLKSFSYKSRQFKSSIYKAIKNAL